MRRETSLTALFDDKRRLALYIFEECEEALTATTLLQPADLTNDMLPEASYYYDADDLSNDADNDTLTLNR